MRRPNCFLVGPGKSGTTSLYAWLNDHPQVFMSRRKEPRYFATDMPGLLERVATEDEYLALFGNAGPEHLAVGEASTQYIFSRDALSNIKAFAPLARIVVTLRSPIEMAPSAYSEARFWFFEDEPDFESSWRAHARRAREGRPAPYPQIGPWPDMCRTGAQVGRLLEIFPRDQVHFILHDDLKAAPGRVYEETLAFLGVPSDGRRVFASRNVNKDHRWRWLGRFLQQPAPPLDAVRRLMARRPFGMPDAWHHLRELNMTRPLRQPVNEEFRRELIDEFREDVNVLGRLIGRDLGHWLT